MSRRRRASRIPNTTSRPTATTFSRSITTKDFLLRDSRRRQCRSHRKPNAWRQEWRERTAANGAAKDDASKPSSGKQGDNAVEPGDEMKVVYHIDEGPQTRVKRVFVTGYNHTRIGAIRREITVKPDAPLREGDVVDSQRRLYNLGIFNRVTIEPQNPAGHRRE